MIQRVAIAFMLLLKPKFLLCDELTSALDVISQQLVLDELLKINQEFGTTIIFVTHDFGIAKRISDHVAFIDNGCLKAYGTAENVLSHQTDSHVKRFIDALYSLEVRTSPQESYSDYLSAREDLLHFSSVTKSYGSKKSLDDVSFVLKKGEVLGIVGESGSGKSTLLKAISGLIPFENGEITIENLNVAKAKPQTIGRLLQTVFQDPVASFDPSLTIRQSFAIVERNFRDRLGSKFDLKAKLLKDVDLSLDLLDKYPHELSGGQCQRFAIARALLSQPCLLLCDEITSSLDVVSQRKVIDILKDLKRDYGLTILFISHDLSVVANFCDRIMVLKDGKVVEANLTNQLITKPSEDYTRLLIESVCQV